MHLPRPSRREQTPQITPLINVVFLLLIFFLLFGRISVPELYEVDPPISISQQPPAPGETVLVISAAGELAIGTESIPEPALEEAVRTQLAPGPDGTVMIKADAALDVNRLLEIMTALRRAGAAHLVLLTLPPDG